MQEQLRVNLATQLAVYKEVRQDRAALVAEMQGGATVNVDGYELGGALYDEICRRQAGGRRRGRSPAAACSSRSIDRRRRSRSRSCSSCRARYAARRAGAGPRGAVLEGNRRASTTRAPRLFDATLDLAGGGGVSDRHAVTFANRRGERLVGIVHAPADRRSDTRGRAAVAGRQDARRPAPALQQADRGAGRAGLLGLPLRLLRPGRLRGRGRRGLPRRPLRIGRARPLRRRHPRRARLDAAALPGAALRRRRAVRRRHHRAHGLPRRSARRRPDRRWACRSPSRAAASTRSRR